MAMSVTLPLGGEIKIFSKGASEGRAIADYVDGNRVAGSHATNDLGQPLYRHTVLLAVSDDAEPEDAAFTSPDATIDAKRFEEITLKPGAEVSIRAAATGSSFAELRFKVSGEVATSPAKKSGTEFKKSGTEF